MSRMYGTAKPSNMSIYPPVIDYGEEDMETFDAYFARWPKNLSTIPKEIVHDWIYRHWPQFNEYWSALRPHTWTYNRVQFSNDEIIAIDHVSTWLTQLDIESTEYDEGGIRSQTTLAQYMHTHGTFPVPILVAKDADHVIYPRCDGEHMKAPLQLIEGHGRLACIRSMIRSNAPTLQPLHDVWLVTIP